MLHIYLCEDVPELLNNIKNIITNLIFLKSWDVTFSGSFSTPEQLLDTLTPQNTPGLYFLDIELHASINGLQLASKIREIDPDGFIIFLTAHSKYMPATFYYQLEALDYIMKNSCVPLKDSLASALNTAYIRYEKRLQQRPDIFTFKSGKQLLFFPIQDILYIEALSQTHQTRIYTKTQQATGYETLKELALRLGVSFWHCHRSYIVNKEHIISIDSSSKTLTLSTGKIFPISIRKLSAFNKENTW